MSRRSRGRTSWLNSMRVKPNTNHMQLSCSSSHKSGSPAPAIAGLFLCGLGIANLYPLSLALALAAAPGSSDSANGAIQLLGGMLATAFPYLLGTLADHLGLHAAFTIEPVLIGACAVLLLAGLKFARQLPGFCQIHQHDIS